MDNKEKFITKPWDESLSRAVLLDIMNAHFKYLTAEFHKLITEETFDRIFGKESILSRDIRVFENETGEIIGFTGVSNISGASTSWRLFTIILPEYYETQLPQQVIEAGISLGKKLQIGELVTYSEGPLAAPFDQAYENLGFHPLFYLFRMQLTDIKDVNSPTIPRGVTVRKLKEIDDYDQYVSVSNEAFRPISGSQPTTIEKMKNIHDYRRKLHEVDLIFAYENECLIGLCNMEYDPKESCGYGRELAVHPNYQHRGIGRYLASEGIKQLRSKKCKRIELEAVVDNENAISLYQSLGFRSIEKLKRKCYRINTFSEIIP